MSTPVSACLIVLNLFLVVSNLAGAYDVSCMGFCGTDICLKTYFYDLIAFNPQLPGSI